MFCIARWQDGRRSERKERSRFRLYTVRSNVRKAGDCFCWFVRVRVRATLPACWLVRAGRSLTIRVLHDSARMRVHILSLDRFVHSNPPGVPSTAQIPIAQVNRCHTFNQSFEQTTLGTILRPQTPHVQSTQRVHVTIFKLVKQSTQSLIQLKSRHYGLITSPTLTYLICCMQKKGKKNN